MPGIVPHRHCVVCGKAIEPEEVFCSDRCERKYNDEKRKQRNFLIFMFLLLFGFLLLTILFAPKS